MFPSRDIKGNVPVRSVHSSLVCLSAKAAKVNTLATEILLDSMRLALDIGQSSRTLLSDSSSSVSVVSNSCYICTPCMVGGTWVVLVGKLQLSYDVNSDGGQGSKVYLDKQVVFVVFLVL